MCPYGLNLIGKTLKNIVTLLTLAILSVIVTACTVGARSAAVDSTPTSDFSLKDFMGRWYEIARFDHSFERDMEYVTADYVLQDDGTVEVINSGMRGGEAHTARGRAKTTDTPGRLRASFFWIFYSDYNVLAMGDNGGWALVGSRSPKYLWILSRTPHLEQGVLDSILAKAASRGYDTSKLIYVEQR